MSRSCIVAIAFCSIVASAIALGLYGWVKQPNLRYNKRKQIANPREMSPKGGIKQVLSNSWLD